MLESLIASMMQPSQKLVDDIKNIDGDMIILGVSGKIGYSLAALITNALKASGQSKKVYGAARFSEGNDTEQRLNDLGIVTIKTDFLNDEDIQKLPKVKNVLYLVGYKFGSFGNEAYTWALNSYVPGRIAEYYSESRIVAFSTGCVYPLIAMEDGAPDETVTPTAVGEYAQSCLGRERIFEYFAKKNKTPILIFRLNYAIDVYYGILVELASSIKNNEAIDITMSHVNIIWQPDVCEQAIRSLLHTASPANILNITGPETVSVKWLATKMAEAMKMSVSFTGEPSNVTLLSNAAKSHQLFGYPKTSMLGMIDTVATWVLNGGDLVNKPTSFQERGGQY